MSLLLFASAVTAYAEDKWQLKKDSEGIRIYIGGSTTSAIKALRVELNVKSTPERLAAVLLNIDHQKDWVYSTKSAYVVKRISDNEVIYHSEKSMPWPVANRDGVVRLKIEHAPGGIMNVTAVSTPDGPAVQENIVRATSNIKWKATPVNNNTIYIEYEARVDPGGSLPAWVVNMFVTKGCFETFKKLKQMLEHP